MYKITQENEVLIERFYKQELSDYELSEFQEQLEHDPVFAQHVDKFAYSLEVMTTLFFPERKKRQALLKQKLFAAPTKTPNRSAIIRKIFHSSIWTKVAVVFVIGLGFFYTSSQYWKAPANIDAEWIAKSMVKLDALTDGTNERGAKKNNILTNIGTHYQKGAYLAVLKEIETLDITVSDAVYFDIVLIKGVAYYYTGSRAAAIMEFEKIVKKPNGQRDTALWWLVAVYIEGEKANETKTKENLKLLIESKYATASEAKRLLRSLN